MARAIIIIGVLLVLIGIFWPVISQLFSKIGFGKLPGDIAVEGERSKFYFPIMTCLIVSVVLSVIVWFIQK